MILQVGDVLDQARCGAICEALAPLSLWQDGVETAAGRARTVKHNLQARPDAREVVAAKEIVASAVLGQPIIASAAIPDRIVRIVLSRSEAGMGYGDHVDAPYIDDHRTDLSFTLFLSDPTDYEGGDLILHGLGATDSVKLPAGALVLYPATLVHRVETVRRGVRLAAIGWIKSRVRSAEARSAIFELDQVCRILDESSLPATVLDRLQNVKNNLLRLHGA
jgi:PKHD-type hydroxylase